MVIVSGTPDTSVVLNLSEVSNPTRSVMHRTPSYNQKRIQKILAGGYSFELGGMLTKYEDVRRLDQEKDVSKPFENVSCQRQIQNFLRGGIKFLHLFKCSCFSG